MAASDGPTTTENSVICVAMSEIVLANRSMSRLLASCVPPTTRDAVVIVRYIGESPVLLYDLFCFMVQAATHRRFHSLDTDIPSDNYHVPEPCEKMTVHIVSRAEALELDMVSATRLARSRYFVCVLCCRVQNQGHQAKLTVGA